MRTRFSRWSIALFFLVVISISYLISQKLSLSVSDRIQSAFISELRPLPPEGSEAALYLDELQLMENEIAARQNKMPRKVYEEFESGALELPFVANHRLSLFKNMKLRPKPEEIAASLTKIMKRKGSIGPASADAYFELLNQIYYYDSMAGNSHQLIEYEQKAWLGPEQIRDLLAAFEKKLNQLNLPASKAELARIKRYYENLPQPEFQLPPALLTMARIEYFNQISFLNYDNDTISRKMLAFDLKFNEKPIQIRPYTIRSAYDLSLAELQLKEDLAATGMRRPPKNLFQEHESGEFYDPVVDGFVNPSQAQPSGLLMERLETALKKSLNSLEIQEKVKLQVLDFQRQYLISLPESKFNFDSIKESEYMIMRKLTDYEIPIYADAISARARSRRLPEFRVQKQLDSFFSYQKREDQKLDTQLLKGEQFFEKAILRNLKTVMKTAGYSESLSSHHLLEMRKVLASAAKK